MVDLQQSDYLFARDVYLLVGLAAVLLQALLLDLGLLLAAQLVEGLDAAASRGAREPLVLQLLLNALELVPGRGHVLAAPRPLHLALAGGARPELNFRVIKHSRI